MLRKMCFFIGHRDAPDEIRPALFKEVLRHIEEEGVTCFVVGDHGAFDRFAAAAVREAKKLHPDVELLRLMAYHPSEAAEAEGFDGSWYPEGMENVPRRFAIVRANEAALSAAEYLIAHAHKVGSNSKKLADKAARRGIKVSNI